MEKIILIIFLQIILFSGCIESNKQSITTRSEKQSCYKTSDENYKPIIIGGVDYSKRFVRQNDEHISIFFQQNNIEISLDGIESLQNLKTVRIVGNNLNRLDFMPLSLLPHLKNLQIENSIEGISLTKIPDFTAIQTIKSITISGSALTSMDGIEKASQLKELWILNKIAFRNIQAISLLKNLERLKISCWDDVLNCDGVLNIADLSGSNISYLMIFCRTIDFSEVETLTNLESLIMQWGKPKNIERIAKIPKLKHLVLDNIDDSIPNLDFLSGMFSLRELKLAGNNDETPKDFFYSYHKRKRISLKSLQNLVNLEDLILHGFIIEDFDVLNNLPKLYSVGIGYSEFSPEDNDTLLRPIVNYDDTLE
jgi:hypothetical protein